MRACILSIGDELIVGRTADTNAAWLAAELAKLGITAVEFATVPDDRGAIAGAYARLARLADVVISTGGLGPTADDLTRFGFADVVAPGKPLEEDVAAIAHLDTWFRNRQMPASNLVQAQRPAGSRFLPNPLGTAMGIAGHVGDCLLYALPGPPREMKRMFEDSVKPELATRAGDRVLLTDEVLEYGMGESDAAARLGSLMDRDRNPLVGTSASESIVAARVISKGERAQAAAALDEVIADIEQRWAPYAFGRTGSSLESAVGALLREHHVSLATAESCTGGMLASLLVRNPGSSENYIGGWVTYSNAMKVQCLGVSEETLEQYGAVSREVAGEMARGALLTAGADAAISITGIAGPDGGTLAKPVGTVFIGLARRANGEIDTEVRRFHFSGERQIVRDRSAKAALQMLRFALLGTREHALLWQVDGPPVRWRVAIALGSNVGDSAAHLDFAVQALRQRSDIEDVRVSEWIETDPVGPPGQGKYLNGAMSFSTTLSPRALLAVLLDLERQRGRDRSREVKSGPRTLDLDILLVDEAVIHEEGLRVPHPRLHERRFVLEPLAQIEPDWRHAGAGRSVKSLLASLAAATPG